MVRLVIDDENVLHAHQVGHHTLEHLTLGFLRVQFLPTAPLQELASAFRQVDALARFEGVVVCDYNLGPFHVFEHIARNEFTARVVAVGIIGLEDT